MSAFGFPTLALLVAIGLAGPLLASLPGLRVPVVIGELLVGVVIGKTGFGASIPPTPRSSCSPTSASHW